MSGIHRHNSFPDPNPNPTSFLSTPQTTPLIIILLNKWHQPGAGGGEFKYLRGFDPYLVNSVHHFSSPVLGQAVGDFLRQERDRNQATADYLVANSAVAGTSPASTLAGTGIGGVNVEVSIVGEGDDDEWSMMDDRSWGRENWVMMDE